MSATLSNVQLGTAVATLDGLVSLDANTIYVNGQPVTGLYLNSNANTSNVNTQIKLTSGGQFDIQDSNALSILNISSASRVITGSRFQQSGAPVAGNDLTNKTYVDGLALNAIQKIGTTSGLNGNAKLSATSGSSFSFSDGSGNTLVVYSQQNTAFYTSGGQFIVMNNSVLQSPYFIINEFNGTQTLSHPMTPWTPAQGQDMTNKTYVDSAITSATVNAILKTGSVGINGVFQLLASGSMLFQNSSGTSLLTLSGNGCGINNGLLTGTTNLYTIYLANGANTLLQCDSAGNLQNCPNLEYIYGSATSTLKQSVATGLSFQRQTLQWVRNPNAPQGWRLNCDFEQKFPQSDIPVTIPNLYSSSLNITNTNTEFLTLKNTTNSSDDYINIRFNHGNNNFDALIQSYFDTGNNVYLRFFVANNSQTISSWFMSSNIASNISNLTSFANYFKISDASNNSISTGSDGLTIASSVIRTTAPIVYPNTTLSAPQAGVSPQGGDRIVLWPGGSGFYSYAIGMNGNTMWYNVPGGAIHNFYANGVSTFYISGSGTTITYPGAGADFLTFYQPSTASTNNYINVKFQHGGANNLNSYIQSSLLGTAVTSTLRFYTTTSNVGKEAFQMSVIGTLSLLRSAQTYFQIQDSATNAIYTSSQGINIDSANGNVYLPNTGGQTTFPQSIVIGNTSSSLQFGQLATYQFTNTSVAWSGGYTAGNFTKSSASSYTTITGGVTCYVSSSGNVTVTVRLYNNSNGAYYYFTQTQYFNITYSHVFIPTNNTFTGLPNGVYTLYLYATGSGVTSDGNDYVNMTFRVSPS